MSTQRDKDIEELFTNTIKPYLVSHGGGIKVEKIEDNKVYVQLEGGCRGCPGARATIKNTVQGMLNEKFPEMEVVDVTHL